MKILLTAALALAVLLGAAGAGAAPRETAAPPAPAVPESLARILAARARASWTSDRLPLRVGDVLTVVVDEQTAARERTAHVATGDRGLRADLNAGLGDDDVRIGPNKSFGSGLNSNSRDVGEATHTGDLTAVLSVRVAAVLGDGTFQVKGSRRVSVDGRLQEIAVEGVVRPEDVRSGNVVCSSSLADAVITYKGKKIGPRMGIAGRFLAMLWP
jgi:flagellar L-ring protein precursor FlgH